VYQRFATLDGASEGRAKVIRGGSFTESFPWFGFDLAHHDELFEEKLNLFVELMTEGEVTWSGSTRASLEGQRIFPTTESGSLDAWIGVAEESELLAG
jgi:alkanesulfonate monooxygenase SsuD/methylene tetrahydromethanopterin reductase-like flavin-dependent oxidoreductase (luciferase family)